MSYVSYFFQILERGMLEHMKMQIMHRYLTVWVKWNMSYFWFMMWWLSYIFQDQNAYWSDVWFWYVSDDTVYYWYQVSHIYMTYHDHFYDLCFLICHYVIHVYIYLSLDKTELSTWETEPILLQISKGKTLFWHIFLFETLWNSLSSWETGDYSHT